MKPVHTEGLGLDELRAEIEQIDRRMAVLVSQRSTLVRAVAAHKLDEKILVAEPSHHMVEVAIDEVSDGGDPIFVEGVFRRVAMLFEELEMSETRDHPQKRKTAPQPME